MDNMKYKYVINKKKMHCPISTNMYCVFLSSVTLFIRKKDGHIGKE